MPSCVARPSSNVNDTAPEPSTLGERIAAARAPLLHLLHDAGLDVWAVSESPIRAGDASRDSPAKAVADPDLALADLGVRAARPG